MVRWMLAYVKKKIYLEMGTFGVLKKEWNYKKIFVKVILAAVSRLDVETMESVESVNNSGTVHLILESAYGTGKQENNSKRNFGYGTAW